MNKTMFLRWGVTGCLALAGLRGSLVFSDMHPPTGLQVPTATAKTAATPEVAPTYKDYIFYGDRYRDPFVPLNGDIQSDQSALDRPPQVASLALKGIVQDSRGRMALLTSGLSSYILRGGRLYDSRNRMVRKVAGVIKTDSVVIIGSDRTVRELKTKAPL